VQGRPVNGFVPVDRFTLGVDGETGVSRGWATVFPLRIGLVVFPLIIGLLVFCASAIVMVAVTAMTLRPISAMRFRHVRSPGPDTDEILVIFWNARKV
jgi:hypothetical protein